PSSGSAIASSRRTGRGWRRSRRGGGCWGTMCRPTTSLGWRRSRALRRWGDRGRRVMVPPTYRVMFVGLRCDRAPFSDKRVRQALNYAIDREALTKGVMGGLAPVARAPLPDGIFGFNPSLPPYRSDPARAKKLLNEAGAAGATLNLGVPVGRYLLDKQVGEAVAGFLEDAGLTVKLEATSWSAYIGEITK